LVGFIVAKKNSKQVSPNFSAQWALVLGASLITLYFNSKIQDPFNSPKLWLLVLLAAWSFGHLITNVKFLFKRYKTEVIVIGLFLISGLISLILTNPFYTGFFGETQRRNGYLSYFCLSVIFLVAILKFRFEFISRFGLITIAVGLVLSVYGLMQISGLDFVKWNNPYNAVISTVGNPNFAAAIMAIMATLNFGFALDAKANKLQRVFHVAVFVLSLAAILKSDARQGLVSLSIGIGVISIVYIHSKNRIIGWVSGGLALIVGFLSIFGMLQKGPLTSLLYKDSVSVRGYYWRAGISMLKDNFLFGVGQDRYGAYFKTYRESNYSLNYGFDITSSNAHNVPIQLFATGGIFFGISYLLLIYLVLRAGYKGIKNSNGQQRIIISTIFSGWLAYQAQSLISIDNLGISIWGWVLSGLVISLSMAVTSQNEEQSLTRLQNKNEIKLLQPIISGAVTLLAIVLVATLYKGEDAMFQTRIRYNPQDVNSKNITLEYASKVLKTPLIEPAYRTASMNFLSAVGFTEKALEELNLQLIYDPRNLDVLNPIAEINERLGRVHEAIIAREAIQVIDPWNSRNLLQLGREYKLIENFEKMLKVKKDILDFDITSKESIAAKTELISQ